VTGANGENVMEARAATQAEAWHRAAEQTRSLGMLGAAGFSLTYTSQHGLIGRAAARGLVSS
jgi:hypothetical protein